MDNTLCNCSIHYKERQNQLAEYQAIRTKHDKEFCLGLLKRIDVSFTETPEGFSRDRFPRAFAATSAVLDIMMGNDVDDAAAKHSWLIGDAVFTDPYPLFDGVPNMLQSYKDAGFNLFLLTKGDYTVQMNKIINNKLIDFFPKDHIYIVPKKSWRELIRIIDDHNLGQDDTVMIGDSIKDDIGSAKFIKILSVLVADSTGTWDYENEKHDPNHYIKSVIELPTIIDPNTSFQLVD